MRSLGADLFPRAVDAIVVTHHHGDHCAHLEPLARATKAPLYLHRGVSASRARRRWETREFDVSAPFRVRDVELRAFAVPHDAPQVALSAHEDEGAAFGVATDLGHAPRGLASFLGACDAVLVESNYDPEMLALGPYPPRLKERVRGGLGHLANEQCAELAASLASSRVATVYLGHLSRSNNTPARALAAVAPRARGMAVQTIDHGVPRAFDVAPSGRSAAPREQLAFAF
jgi:phosphoribosyl 1,2-cyclic phosphodiesterase